MGSVIMIDVQADQPIFAGLALLGYGSGGLPQILPPEAVEQARDIDWLRAYLPELARERFGTARLDPQAAKEKRRGQRPR